jgi:hypothetical protein
VEIEGKSILGALEDRHDEAYAKLLEEHFDDDHHWPDQFGVDPETGLRIEDTF